ncbi:unnamed protein product, partial [Porites lobata]
MDKIICSLVTVFNFLQPVSEKMKYWDVKKKSAREADQEGKVRNKPGPKRQVPLFAEFILALTFRLLVGISPTGAFTFVSKLWSGGVSDRNITIKSGLIDTLRPNDDRMAD